MIIMEMFRDFRQYTLSQKLVFVGAVCLVLYAVVGFFVLPPVVKYTLHKKVPELLNRQVMVERVRINPFALSLKISGFVLKDRRDNHDFVTFDNLYVNAQLSSLFKRTLIVKEINILHPWVRISKTGDRFNFSDLLDSSEKGEDDPKSQVGLMVGNITLTDGMIELSEEDGERLIRRVEVEIPAYTVNQISFLADSTGADKENPHWYFSIAESTLADTTIEINDKEPDENFKTTISAIQASLKEFSSRPGSNASFAVSLQSESGERIASSGSLGIAPLQAAGQFSLRQMVLPKYQPYLSAFLVPEVTGGKVSISGSFRFDGSKDIAETTVSKMKLDVADIILKGEDAEQPIIHVGLFTLNDSSLNLADQEMIIGSLAMQSSELRTIRFKDGSLNLDALVRQTGDSSSRAGKKDKETPWKVTLEKVSIAGLGVSFEDRLPETKAVTSVEIDSLNAEKLSTERDADGSFAVELRINEQGTVSAQGTVGVVPPRAEFTLSVDNFALKPLQPYLADVADLLVTDGNFGGRGDLKFKVEDGEAVVRFTGRCSIDDLKTLDARQGEQLLGWSDLGLEGIDIDSSTATYLVGEVQLRDLFVGLTVAGDGTVNLLSVGRKEKDAEMAAAPEENRQGKTRISIGAVTLENSRFDILDRSVSPHYGASLSRLSGSVTGLSSDGIGEGRASFTGMLNQDAPFQVAGSINPFLEDLFADITIELRNFDMNPVSPYTGKFIGKKIGKGKMNLDLHYRIEKRHLEAKNKIFLDQFTLGETVNSPDAISLPIGLAVSLLKNRKGEITINLPVAGNLDDPEFSIGGIVFQALFNLIAKAATSPFSLLGALVPEGKDLQQVEFDPGSAVITEGAAKKLKILATALYERPGLKVDVTGSVDSLSDLVALKEDQLIRQLKLAKLHDGGKTAQDVIDLQSVSLDDDYELYLGRAYESLQQGLSREKRAGKEKPQPDDMRRLLLDSISLGSDALRMLAISRAEAVKNYLVVNGQVEPERLFMNEPSIDMGQADIAEDDLAVDKEKRSVRMVIK